MISEHNIDLTDTLEEDGCRDIKEKVVKYQDVYEFYKKRKNILQVRQLTVHAWNNMIHSHQFHIIIFVFRRN